MTPNATEVHDPAQPALLDQQIPRGEVPVDPDGWTLRQGPARRRFQPFVEFKGAATNVSMSGAGHLQSAPLHQYDLPALRRANSFARWHQHNHTSGPYECLIQRLGEATVADIL